MYSLFLIKASATYRRAGTEWILEVECQRQEYWGFKKFVEGEIAVLVSFLRFMNISETWCVFIVPSPTPQHQIRVKLKCSYITLNGEHTMQQIDDAL